MRAVLDTNVLIAAFLTDGLCAGLLRRARADQYEFILGTPVLLEFRKILKEKFSFGDKDIRFFTSILAEVSTPFAPERDPGIVCRDPDDVALIACAVQAGAEFLVTGDKDLLVLERHGSVRIITPRCFEMLFE